MPQVIAFEATQVEPAKSASEIEEMLQKAGVDKIGKEFESGRIKAFYFQMATPQGTMPFNLPVNVDGVYQLLLNKRMKQSHYKHRPIPRDVKDRLFDQAHRTAWRIIHWWLKGQLALIASELVTVTEVFLPYLLVDGKQTLYEHVMAGGVHGLLPAAKR